MLTTLFYLQIKRGTDRQVRRDGQGSRKIRLKMNYKNQNDDKYRKIFDYIRIIKDRISIRVYMYT